LTEHHLNTYSRGQLEEHAKGLQQVLGRDKTGDVPDTDQELRTWIADLQQKFLVPLPSDEHVFVGDTQLPILSEATLKACHPRRLQTHAVHLAQTLLLPIPPDDIDLCEWASLVQRLHLQPRLAPQGILDGEQVQRRDFMRLHAGDFALCDGMMLPVLPEPVLRVCPTSNLQMHSADLQKAFGQLAPAEEAKLVPWIFDVQQSKLLPLCLGRRTGTPSHLRIQPGSRMVLGDSSDSSGSGGASRLESRLSDVSRGQMSECGTCGLPVLPGKLTPTPPKAHTASGSSASESPALMKFPPTPTVLSTDSASSLMRMDARSPPAAVSDLASSAGAPSRTGHASSDSGGSLMRMEAMSPPAAVSDIDTPDAGKNIARGAAPHDDTADRAAAAGSPGPLAGAPSPVAPSSMDSRAQTPAPSSTGTTPPPKKWCCCC